MNIRYYIYILLLSLILLSNKPAVSQDEAMGSADFSVKKAVDLADEKQREAQKKASLINNNFNNGKACFNARRYKEATEYFEDIIDIDPSYEPAKLYLESAIIHLEIAKEDEEIAKVKLQMANIMSEYDSRKERSESLAIKYFLEQAQIKCQAGDYMAAEEIYNLCYRINPYSKNKIEWFVKATHDLVRLSKSLDEHAKKIEELAVFEP